MYCKARDRPVLREANAKTWRVYKCVHDQGGRDKYLKREGRDWQKVRKRPGMRVVRKPSDRPRPRFDKWVVTADRRPERDGCFRTSDVSHRANADSGTGRSESPYAQK
jgi:hypothetical protein